MDDMKEGYIIHILLSLHGVRDERIYYMLDGI